MHRIFDGVIPLQVCAVLRQEPWERQQWVNDQWQAIFDSQHITTSASASLPSLPPLLPVPLPLPSLLLVPHPLPSLFPFHLNLASVCMAVSRGSKEVGAGSDLECSQFQPLFSQHFFFKITYLTSERTTTCLRNVELFYWNETMKWKSLEIFNHFFS